MKSAASHSSPKGPTGFKLVSSRHERQPHHDRQRLVGYASTFGDDVFVARRMTLRSRRTTPDREHGRHRKLAQGLSNGGRRRVLSDARELAGDQQLDADVHMVGLSRVRPVIGYSGWPFESTQLDPCAHARVVGGLGLFDYDPRRWPDPALKNRRLLPLSRRAHSHGCCRPTLPVVALAPRPADDLKKWLAD